MRVRILGCSGGIGGDRHTTSMLVDDDILIDAGSGVGRLSLEEMAGIGHLFITHAHLDHIMMLPALLDSVGVERETPLEVHALPGVIDILKTHLFNWKLWPDFAKVPMEAHPFMRYAPLEIGQAIKLGEREIIAAPVCHGVPAAGYLLRGANASLLFSGDTASHAGLYDLANASPDLRHFIVETSFTSEQQALAETSNHYCPATLLPDLARLKAGVSVWVTHLKPGGEEAIMAELRNVELACGAPQALVQDQSFEI